MGDGLTIRGLHAAATPADAVEELAKVKAAQDAIGHYDRAVRGWLEPRLRALGEAAGGQFTLRADAGIAYIAGGNVKVRVSDPDAFGPWADEHLGGVAEPRTQVDVTDHEALAMALRTLADLEREYHPGVREFVPFRECAQDMAACLTVSDCWHIDSAAVDALVADGSLVGNPDTGRVHWSETGEAVPGLTAERTRETLTVKADAGLRGRLADRLTAALPALDTGEDTDG